MESTDDAGREEFWARFRCGQLASQNCSAKIGAAPGWPMAIAVLSHTLSIRNVFGEMLRTLVWKSMTLGPNCLSITNAAA